MYQDAWSKELAERSCCRTMAGKPFKVGRFAHSLRVRLMREHVGVDVDALDEQELLRREPTKHEQEQEPWAPDAEHQQGHEGVTHPEGHAGHFANLVRFAGDTMGQGRFKISFSDAIFM